MSASTATFNEIISRSWVTSEITSSTISQVWSFFEEAFSGFDEVTTSRSSSALTIYLDDLNKMKIIVSVDGSYGVLIDYYLGSEKCAVSSSTSYDNTVISYLRTAYGVAWGINVLTPEYAFENYYLPKAAPTMFTNVTRIEGYPYYVFSAEHTNIETINEYFPMIAPNLGGRKFLLSNPYSFETKLRTKHFCKVLGIPYQNFSRGETRINGKNYFLCGSRFALEFEEENE